MTMADAKRMMDDPIGKSGKVKRRRINDLCGAMGSLEINSETIDAYNRFTVFLDDHLQELLVVNQGIPAYVGNVAIITRKIIGHQFDENNVLVSEKMHKNQHMLMEKLRKREEDGNFLIPTKRSTVEFLTGMFGDGMDEESLQQQNFAEILLQRAREYYAIDIKVKKPTKENKRPKRLYDIIGRMEEFELDEALREECKDFLLLVREVFTNTPNDYPDLYKRVLGEELDTSYIDIERAEKARRERAALNRTYLEKLEDGENALGKKGAEELPTDQVLELLRARIGKIQGGESGTIKTGRNLDLQLFSEEFEGLLEWYGQNKKERTHLLSQISQDPYMKTGFESLLRANRSGYYNDARFIQIRGDYWPADQI